MQKRIETDKTINYRNYDKARLFYDSMLKGFEVQSYDNKYPIISIVILKVLRSSMYIGGEV